MGGKKLEIWYLSHFQAVKKAQSSLSNAQSRLLLRCSHLTRGKSGNLAFVAFKAMKAQSSSCQCTDSPEPLLLAQMRPKSASTRLIDDINGIILLVVGQVPSLAMCEYHTIGHFFKNSVSCSMKSSRCPRGIKIFILIMFLFLFFE